MYVWTCVPAFSASFVVEMLRNGYLVEGMRYRPDMWMGDMRLVRGEAVYRLSSFRRQLGSHAPLRRKTHNYPLQSKTSIIMEVHTCTRSVLQLHFRWHVLNEHHTDSQRHNFVLTYAVAFAT